VSGLKDGRAVETALQILRDLGLVGEVYSESGVRAKAAVSEGRIESIEERHDLGIGVRLFLDGRFGFAFTTDLAPEALRGAVNEAREIARHATPDEGWRLPAREPVPPLPFRNDSAEGGAFSMPRRIDMARAVEAAALAVDPRVRRSRQAVVIDLRGEVRVANSGGLDAGYRYSRGLAWVDVAATEQDGSQVGHHAEFALAAQEIDPAAVGREAARKAIAKLGSTPGRTGRVPAVLDREVVSGLLEALAPAFSARRILKGTSFLAGRLGDVVASPAVTLVDDPRLAGGFGTAPADGEGLPTHRTALVEEGRLRGYLHDTYSAAKTGIGRAGNTVRGSYGAPPQIGPMNLLLLPGAEPVEALLARAGHGVLVTELMGLHTADPVSGDFSLGGSGRRLVGGRAGAPVDQLAISGNFLDLLSSIEAVGSDLRLLPGGGGAPSVLLRELSVAGRS
jgi:PmbA protein